MTLMSRLFAGMYHLPPAETYAVLVERNLAALMPDGVLMSAADQQVCHDPQHPSAIILPVV